MPGRCSGPCSGSWRSTGPSRMRGSGRSAAPGGISCTPRSWRGSRSTVRPASPPDGMPGPAPRVSREPGRDPPGSLRARVRRHARGVHPVLRIDRAGRGRAADSGGRLPAAGRPAGGVNHRGRPARADAGTAWSAGTSCPRPPTRAVQPGWADWDRGCVPGLQLLAGQRPAYDRPGRRGRPSCSAACWTCATTWACSARSMTPGTAARSGTRPRRSVTCRSSRLR